MVSIFQKVPKFWLLTILQVMALLALGAASAATKLPRIMTWMTLDVGSQTYNMTTAIGHAISTIEGVKIRQVPTTSDGARWSNLLSGRADLAVGPTEVGFEGLVEFAEPQWGPQPVRAVANGWPDTNFLMACAKDVNVSHPRDLAGKRLVWVSGAFGFNQSARAWLAYAGLSDTDITWTKIPGYGAAGRAVLENKADCMWAATGTQHLYEMQSSPRGYNPVDLDENAPLTHPEAWVRLKQFTPFIIYGEGTKGADRAGGVKLSEQPHHGVKNAFPTFVVTAETAADKVYLMSKAIYEAWLHPTHSFNGTIPGTEGFDLARLKMRPSVPFHDGAISYFKEKGVWTPELEAEQQQLLQREQALQRAWQIAQDKALEEKTKAENFPALWMIVRADELRKAGMEPFFDTPYWLEK
jgi:TRAP transporter TAXI family solute receptor